MMIISSFLFLVLSVHSIDFATSKSNGSTSISSSSKILVAGSANLDTFLPLKRLPVEGENLSLLPNTDPIIDVPGGKGCNQAIACSKLSKPKRRSDDDDVVHFLSRLGDVSIDGPTVKLTQALKKHGVNTDFCHECKGMVSGRGYVFLQKETGRVSAVISGGSNLNGWSDWNNEQTEQRNESFLNEIFHSTQPKCVLLQREIPEFVNHQLAKYVARVHNRQNDNGHFRTIVLQDIGGEERPMTEEMMSYCDYIMPNETELLRLIQTFISKERYESILQRYINLSNDISNNINDDENSFNSIIVELASILQENGANSVLVTLGEKGSILITKESEDGNQKSIHTQKALQFKNDMDIVDETGAGDCYRAGFAVALCEGKSMEESMEFASAAGALAVTREGAVPSIPTRQEVEEFIVWNNQLLLNASDQLKVDGVQRFSRGGAIESSVAAKKDAEDEFPFMFGSRLNSMKDRPELWPNPVDNVREWVKRQSQIKGLGCVDFNWPQHFQSWDAVEAKKALDEAGLAAGAVCLRYPVKFARGAMIHPDEKLRREAIDLTKQAADVARKLGCNEVVVWSAYDGYDYPFQVNYNEKWDQIVEAFQECCDEYPDIKWSLEFKPTDENTRFFTVPSTGAAMLLLRDIDRSNMGLTLDVGHMLMAGENPAQSISMVREKLFGIQLNDGYTRLAAEDGMMFASVHPIMALEIMYQLIENNFSGHLYFDTFPQRTDPIKECEYNIRKVKEFWQVAKQLNERGIKEIMSQHDAVGALNLLNFSFL